MIEVLYSTGRNSHFSENFISQNFLCSVIFIGADNCRVLSELQGAENLCLTGPCLCFPHPVLLVQKAFLSHFHINFRRFYGNFRQLMYFYCAIFLSAHPTRWAESISGNGVCVYVCMCVITSKMINMTARRLHRPL